MPFMESLPIAWRTGSATAVTESETYGSVIRSLREFALKQFDTEPQWRKKGPELLTGYIPDWDDNRAQSIVSKPRQGTGNQSHAAAGARTAGKTVASGTRALVAVWCRSVGATWTLELHELGSRMTLGALVDWISSGVPTSQPQPDEALVRQLLADRGLRTAPLPGFRRRPLHEQPKQHRLRKRRPVRVNQVDARRGGIGLRRPAQDDSMKSSLR